jgi:hypothetical protein
VSDVPDPLRRLNALHEAMFMAHTTVYDLHRRLVSLDRATPTSQDLLAKSAAIALQRTSEATTAVRRLADQWHEQSVLDPEAADRTAFELEQQLTATEIALRELLVHETAIVTQLRALVDEDG